MNRFIILVACVLACFSSSAQDLGAYGFQISLGYIPNTVFEGKLTSWSETLTMDGNVFNAKTSFYAFFNGKRNLLAIGAAIGANLHHYTINDFRNPDNPLSIVKPDLANRSITGWGLHIGPALGFGSKRMLALIISPQIEFTNVKVGEQATANLNIPLNIDVVIRGWASLGLTYRLLDTKVKDDNKSMEYNVQPNIEFRLSFFRLWRNNR
ncbi:MAG: hypothetical protein LBR28_07440 [Bacteroidales bacterium]|jgi:hypothetical protein|nr:hypothetical protein [Bacteroidales bacterium]